MVKLLKTFLCKSLGYLKVTFSNLMTPFTLSSLIPLTGLLIAGYLSIIAKILDAAILPSEMFLKAGVN